MSHQPEYKKQQPQPGIVELNDEQMEEVAGGFGPWRTPPMGPGGFDPGMFPGGFGPMMGPGGFGPAMGPSGFGPGMGPDGPGPAMPAMGDGGGDEG